MARLVKVLVTQALRPELVPETHGGRRAPTLHSCSLVSTAAQCHVWNYTTHTTPTQVMILKNWDKKNLCWPKASYQMKLGLLGKLQPTKLL